MLEALKPLLESGIINEATRDAITEAWESKLSEARNEIRAEIREEFAERYKHDNELMTEALEKMTSEVLGEEIKKVQTEQKAAIANRVQTVKEMKSLAAKFSNFLTGKLAEEIKEFRSDRKKYQAAAGKLEGFVMTSLAEEITEFNEDKQDLARTKVKLISEANEKFNQLKAKFVTRSSKAVQETVEKVLRSELKQLHEDISAARKNNFGRKIFEAFANEFAGSYLNENKEIRELKNLLVKASTDLAEAKKVIAGKNRVIEGKDSELKRAAANNQRAAILSELMSPLAKEKQVIMGQLLEGIQTDRLKSAYDKYLPSVLSGKKDSSKVLKENRSTITGDKTRSAKAVEEGDDNILDIRRLAGLNQ